MSSRLLILWVVVAQGLIACSSSPHREQGHAFDACVPGQQCAVEGKLSLHAGQPAWASLLVVDSECAKLALPDSFYTGSSAERWDKSKVLVTGRAFR